MAARCRSPTRRAPSARPPRRSLRRGAAMGCSSRRRRPRCFPLGCRTGSYARSPPSRASLASLPTREHVGRRDHGGRGPAGTGAAQRDAAAGGGTANDRACHADSRRRGAAGRPSGRGPRVRVSLRRRLGGRPCDRRQRASRVRSSRSTGSPTGACSSSATRRSRGPTRSPTLRRSRGSSPPADPLFVGSWVALQYDLSGTGLDDDDVSFIVDDNPDAAFISHTSFAGLPGARKVPMLTAGIILGSFTVSMVETATGDVLDRHPFEVTDHWHEPDFGPSRMFAGESAPRPAGDWGGGPNAPQNLGTNRHSGRWRLGVLLVNTTDGSYPTDAAGLAAARKAVLDEVQDGVVFNGKTRSARHYYEELSGWNPGANTRSDDPGPWQPDLRAGQPARGLGHVFRTEEELRRRCHGPKLELPRGDRPDDRHASACPGDSDESRPRGDRRARHGPVFPRRARDGQQPLRVAARSGRDNGRGRAEGDRPGDVRVHLRAAGLRHAGRPTAAHDPIARARPHPRTARPLQLPDLYAGHHEPPHHGLGPHGRQSRRPAPLHPVEPHAPGMGRGRPPEALQLHRRRESRRHDHAAGGRDRRPTASAPGTGPLSRGRDPPRGRVERVPGVPRQAGEPNRRHAAERPARRHHRRHVGQLQQLPHPPADRVRPQRRRWRRATPRHQQGLRGHRSRQPEEARRHRQVEGRRQRGRPNPVQRGREGGSGHPAMERPAELAEPGHRNPQRPLEGRPGKVGEHPVGRADKRSRREGAQQWRQARKGGEGRLRRDSVLQRRRTTGASGQRREGHSGR